MSKENEKNVGTENGQQGQVQDTPAQAEPQVATTAETKQKKGFGTWLKEHWKGVTAGVLGAITVGGSAVVAYKKGKQAGLSYCPPPQEDDGTYSLNPNE